MKLQSTKIYCVESFIIIKVGRATFGKIANVNVQKFYRSFKYFRIMSSKPPFHHLNGRRQQYVQRPMPESPHYEVIKYIHDSWKNICREIEVSRSCGAEGKPSTIAYYSSNLPDEQFPRPDFKRFDLDAFLEQRSLAIQANKQPSQ